MSGFAAQMSYACALIWLDWNQLDLGGLAQPNVEEMGWTRLVVV